MHYGPMRKWAITRSNVVTRPLRRRCALQVARHRREDRTRADFCSFVTFNVKLWRYDNAAKLRAGKGWK